MHACSCFGSYKLCETRKARFLSLACVWAFPGEKWQKETPKGNCSVTIVSGLFCNGTPFSLHLLLLKFFWFVVITSVQLWLVKAARVVMSKITGESCSSPMQPRNSCVHVDGCWTPKLSRLPREGEVPSNCRCCGLWAFAHVCTYYKCWALNQA